MSKRTKLQPTLTQAGFGHVVGILLVVLVFAAIGLIGYKLYANPRNNDNTTGTSSSAKRVTDLNASSAPQIKNTSDLDAAGSVLDQVDTTSSNSSDTSQLDSQLNSF